MTLTIVVHNRPSKMLHLERPNNNIHEGCAHKMKVFEPNKLKKLVTPPTTLNPTLTLLHVHCSSVQIIRNFFDVVFRTIECP